MAFEIATELASSAPAAALNSASRPSSAAPVAAAARMTCSPSSELSATRRLAAGVADAAVMDLSPPDGPAIDCAQPVASTTTPASVQTDFTIVDVSIVLILLGWLESVHADLAAHRGVTLAEVRVHPRGSELHDRGRSPALEALGEAAVALCRSTGGHGVRDVVPVGPRHARAGLDVDLTWSELEDLHGYLRLRRRRRGDTGTCEKRSEKPGAAQDVSRLHRCPSFTRSTGRFGLWIGLLPSGGVAARWFLLAILTGSYAAGAFGMLRISPLSPSLVAGFRLTRLEVALMVPAIYLGGLLFSLPAGRLADRIVVRPSLLGGLIVGAAGLAVGAAAPAFPAFLFCLFVAGSGWSVVNPALGKAIMDLFPAPERGMAMG